MTKKSKKMAKKGSGSENLKDTIESLLYRADIQELYDKYGFDVLCSSVIVLVNSGPLKTISSSFSGWGDFPPAAEPGSGVPEEAAAEEDTWVPEPKPAAEASPYDLPYEPEVAAKDDQAKKDPEPEVMEEEYVDVGVIEEKPCEEKPCDDDDIPPPPDEDDDDDDDDDASASDKPPEEATKPGDLEEDEETKHGSDDLLGTSEDCAPHEGRHDNEDDAADLQLSSQYELMMQLQRYLERACYAYGCREIPATLSQNGWDCDEAVPLERWMSKFFGQCENFETEASVESLQSLFRRLRQVQRITLHRTRLTSDKIIGFLSDAHTLMMILNVRGYEELIKKLELRIRQLLVDFDDRNRSFRRRRDEKMKQVQSERTRLDRLEKAILAEMEDDMEGSQRMVKREIRSALDKTAATFETDIDWEKNKGE
ncbi:hypothetical protein Forpi1262_v018745 [Fusarium oxysporum f. sp. raphani]|uniref:Uncharacterized protein n=1 Tax=Fusarium oxysporum f. sp. raphani TaxID=96318 RepID=A0A8J5NHF5_FUSOX|nr:hypothetical protein Forpi1262_v018745 [Fusarium oxysporum f. sp. raphani]